MVYPASLNLVTPSPVHGAEKYCKGSINILLASNGPRPSARFPHPASIDPHADEVINCPLGNSLAFVLRQRLAQSLHDLPCPDQGIRNRVG
jgi:hypothetical protein